MEKSLEYFFNNPWRNFKRNFSKIETLETSLKKIIGISYFPLEFLDLIFTKIPEVKSERIHGGISEKVNGKFFRTIHAEISEGITKGISERVPGIFFKSRKVVRKQYVEYSL